MTAFYNDIDKKNCAWLKELIEDNQIAPGVVDNRNIWDIQPKELQQYDQVHLFAGIGVWSYAIRQAGISDSTRIWTASCPCQPFSQTGGGLRHADHRHLWPAAAWLISECRPDLIFGEQVAGKPGLTWLDHVQLDLETNGFTTAAATFPASSVGAPHPRQRLYWMAHSYHNGSQRQQQICEQVRRQKQAVREDGLRNRTGDQQPKQTNGFWRDVDWFACQDGWRRPVKSGLEPLVDGTSTSLVSSSDPSIQEVEATKEARVTRLKGYGNSIVAEQATIFIQSTIEAIME